MKEYTASYTITVWAKDLREAKKQLRADFEFGFTPQDLAEELIDGLTEIKPTKAPRDG